MVAVVPAVIDHDILAQALLERENGDGDDPDMEMRYDDEERNFNMSAAQLAEAASKAEVLSLSYRNLCQLDNLQGFSSLVKLCLDNNAIEKMENLGHLQQLRWLDLSFNKIQRIEGLDTLLQLEDLSLFNNEVSTIEGLNACRKLQCLSLGNNKIATLDNIFGLRDFPRLEMVNLTGNPMCNESEYKYTVLAFLPSIKYHDYSLVDATEVEQAKEQYQDELIDLQEKEALEEERLARERTALKEEGELKAANLLIAKTLSADIFAADTEMVKLRYLPRIDQLVDQLNSQIGTSADVFVSAGLSKARHKMEQQRLFETARDSLRDDHARKSISLIEAYSRQKKRVLKEMGLQDAGNTADLSELQDELDRLETLLMDQEIYQVEQQIELINEYETACSEIRNQCYELQQTFFRACEAHEEEYFNAVGMLAQDMLERAAKNELPEDMPDELSNLVIDRDTCMNSVVGSHDIHVGKILSSEDEVRAAEGRQMQENLDDAQRQELQRNRARVIEITQFIQGNRRELGDLLLSSKSMDDGYEEASITA